MNTARLRWRIEWGSEMLLITCPWCGPRAESEFSYGGEADVVRPQQPEARSDEQWADYLFMRKNSKGPHREQWLHEQGCRRWFILERDTVSYSVAQAADSSTADE